MSTYLQVIFITQQEVSVSSVPDDSIRFLDQEDFYFDQAPNFAHHLCMGQTAVLTDIYQVVRMRHFFYLIFHGVTPTFKGSIHHLSPLLYPC